MPYANYSPEEVASRGEEIYERDIRPKLDDSCREKFVVIDIESGDYEIDEHDVEASLRLLERRPEGVLFGIRIGHRAAYRLGMRLIDP